MKEQKEDEIWDEADEEIRKYAQYAPYFVAYIICSFYFDGIAVYQNIGMILIFQCMIEVIYQSSTGRLGSWGLSFITWFFWGLFFFFWYLDRPKNLWSSMLPSIMILYFFVNAVFYWRLYKKFKPV